ncbi:DNA helicase [Enterococcus thailandicus]|uniref:UvrD-helicase domain-containing protein n=1 Tax=Enterococcus thailandicus TaxID=417368 RepID=UPI00244D93F2|nr:UvrD-helicase domain-containing protein [Enterococcus thailandicus]GMC03380.1 DNA helicase [Enterococcus thailandicus]GMC08695.1 DNA helicase [Enterococcus thailandicus]
MVRNNLFYINAPAGSGKTFFIKEKINSIFSEKPDANILCITYTKRAANELRSRIISDKVDIRTIHSFMNFFLSPFFSLPESIDYYCELYKESIENRLSKISEEDLNRYRDFYNLDSQKDVIISDISSNITKLYYNERSYDSILYGGISHDNLLDFSFNLLNKFPILKLKLKEMYQYVFLDEAQDTSSEVLKFFYSAIRDSKTELYLFGDKMQEIYDKYDGSFEGELKEFNYDISTEFTTNYRSSQEILNVLKELYQSSLKINQKSNIGELGKQPRLIVCDSIDSYLLQNRNQFYKYLKLRTLNRHRFLNPDENLSAEDIYQEFSKVYPITSKIAPMDVLLPIDNNDNPDPLIKFVYIFSDILNNHRLGNYGFVIQSVQNASFKTEIKNINIFNTNILKLSYHKDKIILKRKLDNASILFTKKSRLSLLLFLESLLKKGILSKDFYEMVLLETNRDGTFRYTNPLAIPVRKYVCLDEYRREPMVSTQHGVKGEGYDKVLFISQDSRNSAIDISGFFGLFSKMNDFNLDDFQSFYYEFKKDVSFVEERARKKIGQFNAGLRDTYQNEFSRIFNKYQNNNYFKEINSNGIIFEERLTLAKFKVMFSYNKVRNILTAYKLFYVGCSRAKEDLVVLVEQSMVSNFFDPFICKMEECHFSIQQT